MVTHLKLISGQGEQETSQGAIFQQKELSLADPLDRITYLYRLLASAHTFGGDVCGITRFLEAGRHMFAAECGLVIRRLSQQVGEVIATNGVDEHFYVGQHLSIEGTPVAEVFVKNETCAMDKVQAIGVLARSFAYTSFVVNAYLGIKVRAFSGEESVLCFISSVPRSHGYSAEDTASLELLAEGVACMINQQHAHTQRKLTDQAMFAMGSVKTLDEYLQQARLPEVYGVPARVVEVLQKRIGQAPLSIGHVAEELNLSKRTLQRRLQQQDVSFAELRDQLRFHYSIDYLIKQHLSIDSISASLDFSDRTSFTNAFKRWTGLSPSTFRKLFRDYV